MRNYLKNNQGITLVELIAALALVSMVAILIMTTLGIGFKHSIAEANKTSTQQEANLIVSKLLNEHRKGECYFIKQGGSPNNLKIMAAPSLCTSPSEPTTGFKDISSSGYNVTLTSASKMINPIKEDYTLVAEVSYKKAKYQINTKLTRYKTTN